MKNENNIEKHTEAAFNELLNHKPLKASEDFYENVLAKIEAEEPQQATIYKLEWVEVLKYAAVVAIMVLNGILAVQAISLKDSFVETTDEYSLVVEDYFYEYNALNEDIE